jgi:hypothetical protein
MNRQLPTAGFLLQTGKASRKDAKINTQDAKSLREIGSKPHPLILLQMEKDGAALQCQIL